MNAAAFGSNIDTVEGLPEIKMAPALIDTAPVREAAKPAKSGPRVRIIIEQNENIPPTGQFFGADGRGYMIRPGVAVDVDMSIISILDTAIMATPIIDPNTQQVVGFQDKLRFPYRVLAHIPAVE